MSPEQFSDIALITICFFVFLLIAGICLYKKIQRFAIFVLLFGFLQGAAYYLLVKDTSLPFWGLVGDEIFVSALFEKAAQGGLFQDFAYSSLPPFYPPLFFWLFAPIGKVFSLNGVQLVKVAAISTLSFFPFVWYSLLSYLYKKQRLLDIAIRPATLALSAVLLFAMIPTDIVILKSYEFTSAALTVIWCFAVVSVFNQQKRHVWAVVLLGISGGILFMWFYFWLFFAAIAVLLYVLFSRHSLSLRDLYFFAGVALVSIVCALPYLGPLANSYLIHGSENWQVGFTYIERIFIHGPLLEWSWRSLLAAIAVVGMLRYRKEKGILLLLSIWITPFIWQIMGLGTIILFDSPLQESKGFYHIHSAVYALVLAILIEKFYQYAQLRQWFKQWQFPLAAVGIWIVGLLLIFGTFHQDINVISVKERAVIEQVDKGLIDFMNTQETGSLTLHSGVMVLHAFRPLNSFIYFNQHASHPAAGFSERARWLTECSLLKEEAEFAGCLVDTPFGRVERFVFFRESEPDFYQVILHIDDYPNGIKEQTIRLPKALFDSPYFDTVYINERYIVLEPIDAL